MFTIVLLSLLVLASTELVQVIELIRHGARGPVVKGYYDTNKWNTELFGQLNAAGLRQHYNLGRKLREEYGNFLSLTFNQNEVLIYSTDFNRTLLSVSAHL
jgi:lysosomal acid phosphatase